MQKLLFALTSFILVASLSASSAFAQGSIELEHDGEPGIWMPSEMAKDVQADLEEMRIIRSEQVLFEGKLQIREDRIENLKLALDLSEKTELKAIGALDKAIDLKIKAEEEVKRWYRHPALWVSVGIVLTIAIEVSAVKVLDAVSD